MDAAGEEAAREVWAECRRESSNMDPTAGKSGLKCKVDKDCREVYMCRQNLSSGDRRQRTVWPLTM